MRVVVDERAGAPARRGQDRGGRPQGGAGGVDVPPIAARRWTTEPLVDGERALLAVLEPGAARAAIRRAGRVLRAGEPIEVERAALSGMQLAIGHLLGQHAMMLEDPGVGDGAGIATHCTCGQQADNVPCLHLACLLLALVVHLDPDRPPHPAGRCSPQTGRRGDERDAAAAHHSGGARVADAGRAADDRLVADAG